MWCVPLGKGFVRKEKSIKWYGRKTKERKMQMCRENPVEGA
jgi:hypothetical protein